MAFDEYIVETLKLRKDYKSYLLSSNPTWKKQLKPIITKIPPFFEDIYDKCNGTDSSKPFDVNTYFIPKFKLMSIEEVVIYTKYVKECHKLEDNAEVIPFLKETYRDFLAYYKCGNIEKIVYVSLNDGVQHKYDSINSFWKTITQFYKSKAIYINDNNEIDINILKEIEITSDFNEDLSFWEV